MHARISPVYLPSHACDLTVYLPRMHSPGDHRRSSKVRGGLGGGSLASLYALLHDDVAPCDDVAFLE